MKAQERAAQELSRITEELGRPANKKLPF
jgi:hypothetical protein